MRPKGSHNRQLQFELAEGLAGSCSETDVEYDGNGFDVGAYVASAKLAFLSEAGKEHPDAAVGGCRRASLPESLIALLQLGLLLMVARTVLSCGSNCSCCECGCC